ncbi:hypothetical protein [Aliarcobacter butzleri]|uniref:hypothetical protein n=1 Tax=Aliarcobacter butzleri TaxID=28197 RepID=UPI002B245917|nr:hypothetical protein [Aliarcobacter butzleri]
MTTNQLTNEQLTMALSLLKKEFDSLKSSFNDLKQIQKDFDVSLEKQFLLLEELPNTVNTNNNNNSISKEELTLQLRELILEDEELLELFTKVIQNISTYNHNKDKLNDYVDNLRSKKKKKFPIVLTSILIFAILTASTYFTYSYFNNKEILIKKETKFYNFDNKAAVFLPIDINVKSLNEDELNYYFIFKNKKYFIPKQSL